MNTKLEMGNLTLLPSLNQIRAGRRNRRIRLETVGQHKKAGDDGLYRQTDLLLHNLQSEPNP